MQRVLKQEAQPSRRSAEECTRDLRCTPMGHQLQSPDQSSPPPKQLYGTVARFAGVPYDVTNSLNIWSSGMWVSTSTGASAAMAAAGGQSMDSNSTDLQYLVRFIDQLALTFDFYIFVSNVFRQLIKIIRYGST